ncbi:guanylate kinase [Anaerobiospirillum sp. NML120448]|uniref:guanylate kinase n=1 Tax=Anaerobiospirillum sp. NML120448 TaxID=2932816 RepID=UPI0032B19591
MMSKGTLFIVSAPSGAGKSSLINALLKKFNLDDSLRLSISHTTRDPRPGEVDHESYHFVSVEEFESLIERNAFFEHAKVFDNYYGTSKEIVLDWINQGKDVLFDIDWQGARLIKEQVPEAIKIFILPPSLDALRQRLIKRGQDEMDVINKRMAQAMSEISHYDEYDYVIINDDFDESLITLRSIILSKRAELKSLQNNNQALLDDMQRQAKEYEAAWLPCASALQAALAASKKSEE